MIVCMECGRRFATVEDSIGHVHMPDCFRVVRKSINGGTYTGSDEFPTIREAISTTEAKLRGITAIYAADVIDATGAVVFSGHRAGYNGTGSRWIWDAA